MPGRAYMWGRGKVGWGGYYIILDITFCKTVVEPGSFNSSHTQINAVTEYILNLLSIYSVMQLTFLVKAAMMALARLTCLLIG